MPCEEGALAKRQSPGHELPVGTCRGLGDERDVELEMFNAATLRGIRCS